MQLNLEEVNKAFTTGYWYWLVIDHRVDGAPDAPPDFTPEGQWVYMPPFDDMMRQTFAENRLQGLADLAPRFVSGKGWRIPPIKP